MNPPAASGKIEPLIRHLRVQRVILDPDLAASYGVAAPATRQTAKEFFPQGQDHWRDDSGPELDQPGWRETQKRLRLFPFAFKGFGLGCGHARSREVCEQRGG